MARLFYALPLPGEISSSIANVVAPHLPDRFFRLVPVTNLHLTMAFLGETEEKLVRRAGALLKTTGLEEPVQTTTLELGGAGAFPNGRDQRVLWIGVCAGTDLLMTAHQALSTALAAAGISWDRKPFRPHLTIAYRRKPRGAGKHSRGDSRGRSNPGEGLSSREERGAAAAALEDLQRALADQRWSFSWPGVVLYESRLNASGAIHTAL